MNQKLTILVVKLYKMKLILLKILKAGYLVSFAGYPAGREPEEQKKNVEQITSDIATRTVGRFSSKLKIYSFILRRRKNLYFLLAGYPAKLLAGYPAKSVSSTTLNIININQPHP